MGWLPGASSYTAASIQHWQRPKHTGKPLKFQRTPLGTSFLGLPPILQEMEGNKILTEPSKLSGNGGGGGSVSHHGADHCWGPRAQVYQVVLGHLVENLQGHRGQQQRSHQRNGVPAGSQESEAAPDGSNEAQEVTARRGMFIRAPTPLNLSSDVLSFPGYGTSAKRGRILHR